MQKINLVSGWLWTEGILIWAQSVVTVALVICDRWHYWPSGLKALKCSSLQTLVLTLWIYLFRCLPSFATLVACVVWSLWHISINVAQGCAGGGLADYCKGKHALDHEGFSTQTAGEWMLLLASQTQWSVQGFSLCVSKPIQFYFFQRGHKTFSFEVLVYAQLDAEEQQEVLWCYGHLFVRSESIAEFCQRENISVVSPKTCPWTSCSCLKNCSLTFSHPVLNRLGQGQKWQGMADNLGYSQSGFSEAFNLRPPYREENVSSLKHFMKV